MGARRGDSPAKFLNCENGGRHGDNVLVIILLYIYMAL